MQLDKLTVKLSFIIGAFKVSIISGTVFLFCAQLYVKQEIKMILPDLEIQSEFAESVQAIEEQKTQAQASLAQAEDLFNSLLQRAFKGELTN